MIFSGESSACTFGKHGNAGIKCNEQNVVLDTNGVKTQNLTGLRKKCVKAVLVPPSFENSKAARKKGKRAKGGSQ